MSKSLNFAILIALVLFLSSSALASSTFNISVYFCKYLGNCPYDYYSSYNSYQPSYYNYNFPSYYNFNDIYFDPPIYRTQVVYPTYYNYSNRIFAPQYPSYYGRVANPTLREIGMTSSLSIPPTYNNASYYYTSTPKCTSSQCYYN